jgi:hypothetical protein
VDTEAVENMAAAENIEAPADTGTADNMATAKRTVPLKGIEKADRKLAEVADWRMRVSKPVDLEVLGALPTVVETHTPAKRQAAWCCCCCCSEPLSADCPANSQSDRIDSRGLATRLTETKSLRLAFGWPFAVDFA